MWNVTLIDNLTYIYWPASYTVSRPKEPLKYSCTIRRPTAIACTLLVSGRKVGLKILYLVVLIKPTLSMEESSEWKLLGMSTCSVM